MNKRSPAVVLVLSAVLGISAAPAWSQETTGQETNNAAICPDAEVLSAKLITDVCWACLFPVRVLGLSLFGGTRPQNAANSMFCSCQDPVLDIPKPGLTIGMWEPSRIIEFVRNPTCAPTLGGIRLPLGNRRLKGTFGTDEVDGSEVAFYNYHVYAFPLLILLELFFDDKCNPDNYVDLDVLYFSELDPTWNNSELGFFANPEAAWLTSPVAQAACMLDVVAANARHPIDQMFWCAGSWGLIYPFAGAMPTVGGPVQYASLASVRALAALHRRGLARRTMGTDAMCEAPIDVFIPKTQYKATMFYPRPEAHRAHMIGESTLLWGMGRTYPGPGEDQLYIWWRWNDCCATFY